MCKECGRQFVENPQNIIISQETRDLIDKLLLERMALAAIVRVTGVSESWLQDYVNQKYDTVPQCIDVKKKRKGTSNNPPVYRQCAVCYTDFWTTYAGIIPSKRHRPVGKESGKTSHIERFNCTMRQRISRS